MLSSIMDEVSSRVAHHGKMLPSDVPGLGDWFADKGVLKARRNSNYQLLNAAVTACPEQSLVTPQVRQLVELYHQAEEAPVRAEIAAAN